MISFQQELLTNHLQPIPLSPNRELNVSELTPSQENLAKIGRIARDWGELVTQIAAKSPEIETGIFYDSYDILGKIANCVAFRRENSEIWNKIFICEDVALKELQAIALVYGMDKGFLSINLMATNPKNIRCHCNLQETGRVEGAAKAIIKHLARTHTIHVESVHSAVPFYKKLGFEDFEVPSESGYPPMILRKENECGSDEEAETAC